MSKLKLEGNASGTGTFTIAAPNSNSDRTLDIPDEAGTLLTSASDLPAANLTGNVAAARITNALNAGGSAPIYACRAWVNFNGSGTVAIREDGNVSSITDEGTGDYTVNFTTAMSDANYAVSITAGATSGFDVAAYETSRTTSSVRAFFHNNGAGIDATFCSVVIFR